MLRRGEALAGRFEALSDEALVVTERRILWKRAQGWFDPPREEKLWLPALDRETGRRVLISPRPPSYAWHLALDEEAIAREVMALGSPWIVPVLHVGPGIVFAEPPPVHPRPALSVRDAARCALQACEVVARMHALGHRPSFGPSCLRLVDDGGAWRIAWLVPGPFAIIQLDLYLAAGPPREPTEAELAAMFDDDPAEAVEDAPPPQPIPSDVQQLAGFFLALLADRDAAPGIAGIHAGRVACDCVVALARALAPLAADPGAAQRVDELPIVRRLPVRARDWDSIIADGESGEIDGYTSLALATAYHQRASKSFAAGEFASALRDIERAVALDTSVTHCTTRALILDKLGLSADARVAIAKALTLADSLQPYEPDVMSLRGDRGLVTAEEHARAHTTAGLFALHDGDLDAAERELRASLAVCRTAAAAHALGAVLYRRGDIAAAATAEALSIRLDPADMRLRWALVVSLQRLGRAAEAKDLASNILQIEPDDPGHRARFARLFGG